MTRDDLQEILNDIECMDYSFEIRELGEGGFLVSAVYDEEDIYTKEIEVQRTRKWYISPFAIKSEIVQTCIKIILTSMEHRVREHFKYRGELVLGPHFDIDALHELAANKRIQVRDKV